VSPGQLCREYAELSEGEEVRPVVGDDGALSGTPDHFEDLRFRRENVEVVEQRLKREKKRVELFPGLEFEPWTQCYKTFSIRNLLIFVVS
jgi:hypothetical protein